MATCLECGADLPPKRPKYCSTQCRQLSVDKKKARRSPCSRCGGDKGYGVRGGKLCQPCREEMQPVWQEMQRERSRVRAAARRQGKPATPLKRGGDKVREDGLVWCPSCEEYLPRASFPKVEKLSKCRPCTRQYNHEHLLKRYGMTSLEYHELLERQDGRCAICRARPRTTRLAVDHDHETGVVRGLLCKRCNKDLLGSGRDDPALLRRAADYLEDPASVIRRDAAEELHLRVEIMVEEAERSGDNEGRTEGTGFSLDGELGVICVPGRFIEDVTAARLPMSALAEKYPGWVPMLEEAVSLGVPGAADLLAMADQAVSGPGVDALRIAASPAR